MLVVGNTSESEALAFCQEHVIAKLPLMAAAPRKPMQVVKTAGLAKTVYWDCIVESKLEKEDAKDGDDEKEADGDQPMEDLTNEKADNEESQEGAAGENDGTEE